MCVRVRETTATEMRGVQTPQDLLPANVSWDIQEQVVSAQVKNYNWNGREQSIFFPLQRCSMSHK